ncbi:hypothetical protein RJZ56_007845 [Blastomyces dermatitidis]|uniref:Uncharacterized protein n=2 Tax=Ajellomyces dermatitidis TaxID=5039 RepID=F2T866_AJEDA|nr:uncharacterized protein BDCG_16965 [Blastomyces dermatitidis ER-3]EGE79429.1 hypothetical protein BDDG_02368 [Blastomyces dermatitidis ATCC 18188]OAT01203.1 hypothetical protein BDCG_16965 [Blastomyces dermatitidis ER-3]
MPLLELVPSLATPHALIERTRAGDDRVCGEQLAYALLREAAHLVWLGWTSWMPLLRTRWVRGGRLQCRLSRIIWGGGEGRLRAFFEKIGVTAQACWEDQEGVGFGKGEGWEERVFRETEEVYGPSVGLSVRERDEKTRAVLNARGEEGSVPKKDR